MIRYQTLKNKATHRARISAEYTGNKKDRRTGEKSLRKRHAVEETIITNLTLGVLSTRQLRTIRVTVIL